MFVRPFSSAVQLKLFVFTLFGQINSIFFRPEKSLHYSGLHYSGIRTIWEGGLLALMQFRATFLHPCPLAGAENPPVGAS